MAAAASDLDDLQVFGGGAASSHPDPEAEHGASSAQPASGKRAKYNDYLGSIADRDPADVDMFSIRRNFENIGLDLSMPDVKIDWREEVTETIHLVERFLLDATSSLRRIMEALRSYDEGNMTMDVKFASSTESRTIERALREPAHAVKGAAATVTFDRVALAFRAIELPLKDAVGRTEAEVVPEATRRARIDATLGPGRHLVRIAWLRLREAIEFVHDDLLAHVLEHRCGISDVEEAQMYIPTQEELDDGEPMPEGEPDDYNQEDWADDIADVAEDIEELGDKLPRDHVELELADFELPPGDGSE